ncbi:hypothetical protein B7494_g3301 [Chlorociboria aeruginascens]|nr:hypothetical protein B7494_g3301 [Chlorociboria aeruginascens]
MYSKSEDAIIQDLDIQLAGFKITHSGTQPIPQNEPDLTPKQQLEKFQTMLCSADVIYCKALLTNFLATYAANKIRTANLAHYTKDAIYDRFKHKLSDPSGIHKAITELLGSVGYDLSAKEDSEEALKKLITRRGIRHVATFLTAATTTTISAHSDLIMIVTSELGMLESDLKEENSSGNYLPGYKEELERLSKVLAEEKMHLRAFFTDVQAQRKEIKALWDKIGASRYNEFYEQATSNQTTLQKRLQICAKIVSDSDRKTIQSLKACFDDVYASFSVLMQKANHKTENRIFLLLLGHRDVSKSPKRAKLIEGLPKLISPIYAPKVFAMMSSCINEVVNDEHDILHAFNDYLNEHVFPREEVEGETHAEMKSWLADFTEARKARMADLVRVAKEVDEEMSVDELSGLCSIDGDGGKESRENRINGKMSFSTNSSEFSYYWEYEYSNGTVIYFNGSLAEPNWFCNATFKADPDIAGIGLALDTLCDMQLVTGTAILIAALVQVNTMSFYHQDLVVDYWFLTLNSFWASRAGYLNLEKDNKDWRFWTRTVAILITDILSVAYQLIIVPRQYKQWDPFRSGYCYIYHDKSVYGQNYLWISGLTFYALYLLLVISDGLTSKVFGLSSWMDRLWDWSVSKENNLRTVYMSRNLVSYPEMAMTMGKYEVTPRARAKRRLASLFPLETISTLIIPDPPSGLSQFNAMGNNASRKVPYTNSHLNNPQASSSVDGNGDPPTSDIPQLFMQPDIPLALPITGNDYSYTNVVSPSVNLPTKYYTYNHANNLPPTYNTPSLDRSHKKDDEPPSKTAICKANVPHREECGLASRNDPPPPREHSLDSGIPDDDGLRVKFSTSQMNFSTLQENLTSLYDRPPESRPRPLRGPFCCRRLKLYNDKDGEQRRRLRRAGPGNPWFTIDWFVQFMAKGQNIILHGEDRLAAMQESDFVFQTTLPLKPKRPPRYFVLSKVAKRMYLELTKDEIERVLKFTHRKVEGDGIAYACDYHRTFIRVKPGIIWSEAERIIRAADLATRCYREGVDLEPVDPDVKGKHVGCSAEDFLALDH